MILIQYLQYYQAHARRRLPLPFSVCAWCYALLESAIFRFQNSSIRPRLFNNGVNLRSQSEISSIFVQIDAIILYFLQGFNPELSNEIYAAFF